MDWIDEHYKQMRKSAKPLDANDLSTRKNDLQKTIINISNRLQPERTQI